MVRRAGRVAMVVIAVWGCDGSEQSARHLGGVDAGDASSLRSDAAPPPSPYPTALPPPNTPCVPPRTFEAPPPRAGALLPCFTCSCDATYEAASPLRFAWNCRATDCPDLCPPSALTPGSSELCDTPYFTSCSYDVDRCSEVCTCRGDPPSPPGFTPLAQYWDCIARCTGCPAGRPPDGAMCWGEPEPCTYGDGASAVTCSCDVFDGEDVVYHGGLWRCAAADAGP